MVDYHNNGLWAIFLEFSTILYCGYTMKFSFTSCCFHTENTRNILYGPHFIWSPSQNCGPNILPYGPHNRSIRAWHSEYYQIVLCSKAALEKSDLISYYELYHHMVHVELHSTFLIMSHQVILHSSWHLTNLAM